MAELITDRKALENFCRKLEGLPYVALDTEFLRDSTYWPQLCLVQASANGHTAAIDPLAEGMDLAPLFEIFDNPKILKVFHAARQDLEIFYHKRQRFPLPLFDTQIAAMACGFGESASYESLARRIMNVQIDKSSRYTNWDRRPLSDAQLHYAISDVTHLCGIYEYLAETIAEKNRGDWIKDETLSLTEPDLYDSSPEKACHRLRFRISGKKRQSTLLAAVAWREREAQRRNIPRRRIMRDDLLREIAIRNPQNKAMLEEMRGLAKGFGESPLGRSLLEALQKANSLEEKMLPEAFPQKAPSNGTSGTVDMLRLLLKRACDRHQIAPKLILSNGDLERIASGDTDMDVFSGWKRQIFGEAALALLRGEIYLSLENGKIQTIDRKDC